MARNDYRGYGLSTSIPMSWRARQGLPGRRQDYQLGYQSVPGYKAVVERVFVIHVEAFDWNCPQHITPRYTAEEIREGVGVVEEEVRSLKQENEALRKELAEMRAVANPENNL